MVNFERKTVQGLFGSNFMHRVVIVSGGLRGVGRQLPSTV